MPFLFIDYTGLYFTAVAKIAEPAVTSGKFVRIRNEAADYLVFSPREFSKYHANIVERFCLDKGIEGRYDPERKRYNIIDQSWFILGGGKFEKQGLREAISSLPEYSGFTVLIE